MIDAAAASAHMHAKVLCSACKLAHKQQLQLITL
jgi:hypothetical protein